jgi:hypothetical protein
MPLLSQLQPPEASVEQGQPDGVVVSTGNLPSGYCPAPSGHAVPIREVRLAAGADHARPAKDAGGPIEGLF